MLCEEAKHQATRFLSEGLLLPQDQSFAGGMGANSVCCTVLCCAVLCCAVLPGFSVPATDGGALPAGPASRRLAVECEQPEHDVGAGQAGGAGLTAVLQEQAGSSPLAGAAHATRNAGGKHGR